MWRKIKNWIIVACVTIAGWFAYINLPPQGAKPTPTPTPIVAQVPTYFAQVDADGNVLRVIVISQENINTGKWGDPASWIETKTDDPIRKNYAGKGMKYDKTNDSFVPPKPRVDAIFNSETATWILPIESPPSIVASTSR